MKVGKLICGALALLHTANIPAAELSSLPLHGQEKDNWCWAGSSEMVLDFFGFPTSQTAIAEYAVGGYDVGNALDANKYVISLLKFRFYQNRGVKQVLQNFGNVKSKRYDRPLSFTEIQEQIDRDQPSVLAIRWLDTKNKDKDAGGHAIVIYGYEGADKVLIRDPWPFDNAPAPGNPGQNFKVKHSILSRSTSTERYPGLTSATYGNRWSQTLVTFKSLDVVFLIDSTGSMSDDIAAVKANSQALLDRLQEEYSDLRVAVVDFRDFPQSPYGESSDYITRVRTAFTEDVATARSAISAISVGGGADIPEAVYSATMEVLSGSGIGAWRESPTERRIILMGDAPGHDPEPWPGGYSYSDVFRQATDKDLPITIHALGIGFDPDAAAVFGGLGGDSGGSATFVDDASGVAAALDGILSGFAESERFPRGDVSVIQPRFAYQPPDEMMYGTPTNFSIEMEKFEPKTSKWKKFRKERTDDSSTWVSARAIPPGEFRWRLTYKRPASTFLYPSGETIKVAGGSVAEDFWTPFLRVPALPGVPDLLLPDNGFSADATEVTYFWVAGLKATAYALEIYRDGKLWKKLRVAPPKSDPLASVLSITVKGHKPGDPYIWRVQSLNYDHPKVDGFTWAY